MDIENDWDYYAKSYNRPKTTLSNRRVKFTFPIAKLNKKTLKFELKSATQPVESFRGNWFLNALEKQN